MNSGFVDARGLQLAIERVNQEKVGPRHQHATSDVNDLPVGAIIPTSWVDAIVFDASSNVWLRCNGQTFNASDFPDLIGLVSGNRTPLLNPLQGMWFYIKATDFRVSPRYPIGWLKILSSIDSSVFAHDSEWLRCDGREVSLEEYPELIGLGGVLPPTTVFWDAIGRMTSNNTPAPFEVSATSTFSESYDAHRAFGRNERPQTHDAWLTGSNTFNLSNGSAVNGSEDLVVKLPGPATITKMAFRSRNTPITAGESSVRDFQLFGSDDGINWELTRTVRNNPPAVLPYQLFEFMVIPQRRFQFWKFSIQAITIGSRSRAHVGVAELHLFETADLPPRVALPNIPLEQRKFTYINAKRTHHVS